MRNENDQVTFGMHFKVENVKARGRPKLMWKKVVDEDL